MKRSKWLLPTLLTASVCATGASIHSSASTPGHEPVDSLFLSLIQAVGSTPAAPKEPELKIGALDFVSSVYEDADYYQTGPFDGRFSLKQKSTVTPPQVYLGRLPDYVMREFYRPVPGIITSPFGWRKRFNRMHKGTDLALHIGDPVCAALKGTVSRVGFEVGGYGNFIVIEHSEGIQTRYAHLDKVLVKVGDHVSPGNVVGLGGSTGRSTGPHLHFEVRCGGVPLDAGPLLVRKVVGKSK